MSDPAKGGYVTGEGGIPVVDNSYILTAAEARAAGLDALFPSPGRT